MKNVSFWERLLGIKKDLKVEKGEYNNFGKFRYRTKEKIMEALKPLEEKYFIYVSTDHELVVINERLFVKATAEALDVLDNGVVKFSRTSYAELQPAGKGVQMNESQLTGSAESYASKRALEAMFGLDDTRDADDEVSTNISIKDKQISKIESKKQIVTIGNVEPIKTKLEYDEEAQPLDVKQALYTLGQKTLYAKTADDFNQLDKELKELGGDEKTSKIIGAAAMAKGLVRNYQTGLWEEIKEIK